MNFEEKAREQAKYAADLTQCGIVMTSEEIYNAVHKFVHAALVSAYEMGCQAGSIAKGEGSSEPAVPLQSGLTAEALLPMDTAPRDRTYIIAKFKDDMAKFNGLTDDPNWHWRWQGKWAPLRHEGFTSDGYDMEWSIALPVGHGGLPSAWFEGWLPVQQPPQRPTDEDEVR